MRKLTATIAMVLASATLAQAAIINVTNANYRVNRVFISKRSFDVELVQNAHKMNQGKITLVHLNDNAKCHIVHPGAPLQNVSRSQFVMAIHRGTRVRVTGGRTFTDNINASEVWAEQ